MDARITIPETALLLALDDESGTPVVDATTLLHVLGAAGLAELVARGRLRVAEEGDGSGVKPGRFVTATAVVEPELESFVEHADGRTPKDALARAIGWGGSRSAANRLRETLLGELVDDGALVHDETRWLGITWAERWKRGARTEHEDALQARARALLAAEHGPVAADDEPIAAALAILHGAKALPKVFADLDPKAIELRGEQLAAESWSSEVVRKAVEAMQVAMMAATMVPIITATTVATS